MSITLLMFAKTLTPRGLFPPGFYINFAYSVFLIQHKSTYSAELRVLLG